MRKNILLILCASAVLILASVLVNQFKAAPNSTGFPTAQDYPRGMTSLNPQPIPDAVFRRFDDSVFDPAGFRGKYVLINFWATWCPPCVVEFPELVEFAADHSDHLAVIMISNDQDTAAVDKFFGQQSAEIQEKMELPNVVQIYDRNGHITRRIFQTYRLPETYLINPDGLMIAKILGAVSEPHFDYLETLWP